MKQHFLQSEAWEKFQQNLGHTTIRKSGDGWSYLAVVERGGGLTRLYCPYGPVLQSPQALEGAIQSLRQEANTYQAAFIRLQPSGVLLDHELVRLHGLRETHYSQPVATRVIDLTPPLEQIIGAISQSKRSICRNYQKKGLCYRKSNDPQAIEALLPLIHDVAERNRISVHSDAYIRSQAAALMPKYASVHFIDYEGVPVTGALVFEGDATNYYAHAGTSAAQYKLQANTALVGELIAYSKDQGKQSFDLYGIAPDDNPSHRWAGVTAFKAGFGGEVVRYNPTYDLPLAKLRYAAYEAARTIQRRLR